jgi:hypothetical protein
MGLGYFRFVLQIIVSSLFADHQITDVIKPHVLIINVK